MVKSEGIVNFMLDKVRHSPRLSSILFCKFIHNKLNFVGFLRLSG